MIFEVPGAHFGYQNGVQNGVQNGISTLMALKSLSEGSWDALGGLLDQKKSTLDRLLGGLKKISRQLAERREC